MTYHHPSLKSAQALIDMEHARLKREESERTRANKRRRLMNGTRQPCAICDHIRPCRDVGGAWVCEEHQETLRSR